MTTPNVRTNTEHFGTIEIFGIPFSTFTRSVVMGLEEVGLTKAYYMQHETPPHSKDVVQRNPFGLLPVLVHRPDAMYTQSDEVVVLFESNAIRRYVDELLAPEANRRLNNKVSLTYRLSDHSHLDVARRAKVDQWVSLASTNLFPAVELGVVKPRLSMESDGAEEDSIKLALQQGLDRLHDRLSIYEQLLQQNARQGDWLCGDHITWADLFVYPPLADLRATPEGEVVRGGKEAVFPKLSAWLDRMDARESAKNTYRGTLASQRKGK